MNKHVEKIAAHPAAAVYRMMLDDELAELVASIGTNGLRDPITVGIIGAQRWIVDGRNRERACELAGVAPAYEEIEFADEEELRAFVADRNERRNISKGQKAMAYALLFPKPIAPAESGARGGKGDKGVHPVDAFSKQLLSQARSILAFSRELAENVRDGRKSLKDAFELADAARKATEADDSLHDRLEREAPDLLAIVDEGKMTLREAIAALDERERRAADAKRAATTSLSRVIASLDPLGGTPADAAKVMFGDADPRFWPKDGLPYSKESWQSCVDVLLADMEQRFQS